MSEVAFAGGSSGGSGESGGAGGPAGDGAGGSSYTFVRLAPAEVSIDADTELVHGSAGRGAGEAPDGEEGPTFGLD